MNPPPNRLTLWQGVYALTLVPLLFYSLILILTWLQLNANDFGKFYYATKYWRAGVSLYQPSPATYMEVNAEEGRWLNFLDLNPPHFHLLVAPLTTLPLRRAALIWFVLNVNAAWLAGVILVRELELRPRAIHALPLAVGVLACAATGATLITGQFTGFLVLLMTLAWRAARRARWDVAGLWLGLLIGVKPFLGLFLPYLILGRHWRALLIAIAVIVGSFGIGFLVFGVTGHREWLQALRVADWTWALMNGSAAGLFARALGPSPYLTPVAMAPRLMVTLSLLGAAVVGGLTLLIGRRSTDNVNVNVVDRGFAAVLLGSLLVSPLGWIYYAWMAIGPCVALWRRRRPVMLWFALPWLAVPLFALVLGQPSPIATVTIGSAYTWGLFFLWLSVVTTPVKT